MGGGGDPISAVVSTVSNTVNQAVSDVSNSFNRETTNATDSVTRSDIGKVAGAGLAPVTGVVRAQESLLHGNVQGAANNLYGGFVGMNPVVMASRSSSTVSDALRSNDVNALSFGYGRDIANEGDITSRFSQSGKANPGDYSSIMDFQKKSGILAGGLAAGSAIGAWATANPAKAALYSSLGGAVSKGDLRGAASALGAPDLLTKILPDGSTIQVPNLPDWGSSSVFPSTSDPLGGTLNGTGTSALSGTVLLTGAALGVAILIMKGKFKI